MQFRGFFVNPVAHLFALWGVGILQFHHADKLREVDVSHVEATAHAIPVFNVFREDEPRDWFTAEEALSNAPHQANQLFIVTKVVE